MEIERKFLVDLSDLPFDPKDYPARKIEQAYLCTAPVVRIRRDNDDFFLTYKSKGMMVREEYNLPLTKESYYHLLLKADGRIITKTRYVIPIENGLFVELDIFEGDLAPLVLAEIEFPDEAFAKAYQAPSWLKGRNLLFRISQQHPQQKRLKQETHRLQTMGSSPLSFDFSSYYRYIIFIFCRFVKHMLHPDQ